MTARLVNSGALARGEFRSCGGLMREAYQGRPITFTDYRSVVRK